MSRHKLRLRRDSPLGPVVGQFPSFRAMNAEIAEELLTCMLKQRPLTLMIIERAANEQEVYLGTLVFSPGDQVQDEYRELLRMLVRQAEAQDVGALMDACKQVKEKLGE